MAPLLK